MMNVDSGCKWGLPVAQCCALYLLVVSLGCSTGAGTGLGAVESCEFRSHHQMEGL
jgi:hypothetical protein